MATLPPSVGRRSRNWIPGAKGVLWIGLLAPVFILGDRIFLFGRLTGGDFVDDPVELIQHWTGNTALILLLVGLASTPLRRLMGWHWTIRFRRLVGLFAFFYATLHVVSWFVFDHQLALNPIIEDVLERNWILVGMLSWLLLIPLALTSTSGWIRRLGGKKWNRLHQLVYPVAALGVLHFLWQTKLLERDPVLYSATLVLLLGVRWLVRKK
ncbi:MAG: sulfite oxidase heme-binding subunit YedZ [Rhodothermales bacterium]